MSGGKGLKIGAGGMDAVLKMAKQLSETANEKRSTYLTNIETLHGKKGRDIVDTLFSGLMFVGSIRDILEHTGVDEQAAAIIDSMTTEYSQLMVSQYMILQGYGEGGMDEFFGLAAQLRDEVTVILQSGMEVDSDATKH